MKLNASVQHQPVNTDRNVSKEKENSETSKHDLIYEKFNAMEQEIKELNKKCQRQPRPFGRHYRNGNQDTKESGAKSQDETKPKDLNW
ncbi:MAG: hypothetical protein N0E59_05800 [Candidatus Thiodiazotropha taylori]|nr:hypothetical protein [Candidatus Thiodiazotropha taylori]MCW4282604.1 hypothetical protein [Candidatus Thiodiazotropha taylori]